MIKTPKFWDNKNILSIILLPLCLVNLLIQKVIKFTKKSNKTQNYIICIGNINIGGSGKTPTAIAIGKILQEQNIDFCYLSSGYGRKSKKDILVKKNTKINYKYIGDEVILLSEIADCYVTNNRLKTLNNIYQKFPKKVIIMDDGFQDVSIKKNLNILVVNGNYAFGNKFIFPAGPLRELIQTGIERSDLGIIINDDKHNISKIFTINEKKILFAKAKVKSKLDKNNKYIAFCGIARAEKFFHSIEDRINIIQKISFKDHHNYSDKDLKKLIKQKEKYSAQLITTKKDWVKFPKEYKTQIKYLDYEVILDNDSKNDLLKLFETMHSLTN